MHMMHVCHVFILYSLMGFFPLYIVGYFGSKEIYPKIPK